MNHKNAGGLLRWLRHYVAPESFGHDEELKALIISAERLAIQRDAEVNIEPRRQGYDDVAQIFAADFDRSHAKAAIAAAGIRRRDVVRSRQYAAQFERAGTRIDR